jgi:hypothetical protein
VGVSAQLRYQTGNSLNRRERYVPAVFYIGLRYTRDGWRAESFQLARAVGGG